VTVIAPTWTSSIHNPYPSCGGAYNLKPECARMGSAYRHYMSSLSSDTVSPIPSASLVSFSYAAAPPCTVLTSMPTPSAKPTCTITLKKEDYFVYYWPTPSPNPTDPSFCSNSTNGTIPTPPPTQTIPDKPNAAIVSGHTLTSPSIYHFLKTPPLSLYAGVAVTPWGFGGFATTIWSTPATPFPTLLTVAQNPHTTPLLSVSKICRGIEADYCSVHPLPSFHIHHISTVPRDAYESNCNAQRHCFDSRAKASAKWGRYIKRIISPRLRCARVRL
jgi:hypothetical protein